MGARKSWETAAIETLRDSLEPLPHEKNEIDWKENLSPDTERLAQHLSAFANYPGGGFVVFGVNNSGELTGLKNLDYGEVIKKLGNIARDGVNPPITIDTWICNWKGKDLLFIRVLESPEKPVYIRGHTIYDSYLRSAGQTRKMTRQEVARAISSSSGTTFEEENASSDIPPEEIIKRLDIQAFFDLLSRPFPQDSNAIIESLISEKLVKKSGSLFSITNLGALLFAKDFNQYDHLKRKEVRVIVYEKTDRLKTVKEQTFPKGYACNFEALIQYIDSQLPRGEVIGPALRRDEKMFPPLAVRELVGNALIHQDFHETGTSPMVEIFSDRLEITNPGKPLINTLRFIDSPPLSRNELIAAFMRRINVCEERGSGIDKVISQVEETQAPAPDFIETENHTKAILYSPRPLSKMDRSDRIRACYQHCSLKYVSGIRMSNQTLRERLRIGPRNYPAATRIISDTMEAKLIKLADPNNRAKKNTAYIPFWA